MSSSTFLILVDNCFIPSFLVFDTAIISCQKNCSFAYDKLLADSDLPNLSIFDNTIVTGNHNSNIYLYISISTS
ncbi:MAG: hypothetical protein Q8S84_09275 [bacterium]|nr:hypothetical protein [bacterium]MDP3381610.1 hypothetical protein [bacterium]